MDHTPEPDQKLLARLREAAARPMSKEERDEQCVSFVYGNLPFRSTMTKDEVRDVLRKGRGA